MTDAPNEAHQHRYHNDKTERTVQQEQEIASLALELQKLPEGEAGHVLRKASRSDV